MSGPLNLFKDRNLTFFFCVPGMIPKSSVRPSVKLIIPCCSPDERFLFGLCGVQAMYASFELSRHWLAQRYPAPEHGTAVAFGAGVVAGYAEAFTVTPFQVSD